MKTLTAREVEYVRAWALAMESAVSDDARLVSLFAMAALGNIPAVRCETHSEAGDLPMTFTAAYRHLADATDGPCRLTQDLSAVNVEDPS